MSSSSPRSLVVAALQLPLGVPVDAVDRLEINSGEAENIAAVAVLVEQAAAQGAQVILPPELFSGPYFCSIEDEALFALARPTTQHPSVIAMQALAARLKVAIPTSFFERDGHHYYNTLAMIGPDGEIMGTYRKSHIPDGPGYEEKYYFRPGNTGFKVWDVFGARIGVGVCWDQWYPECARVMALMGAEVLFYPTAIGSEPYDAGLDTSRMWRRAMQGHAVSNCMPVIAANRIGTETMPSGASANPAAMQSFYGHSFIADEWGDLVAEYGASETGVLTARLDLDRCATHRAGMGFFRDRRPQLYGRLCEDD
jgi:N-carbamoylputrescine amidase